MADLNNLLIRKHKNFSATACTRLSPTNDSVDDRPSDHAIPSTMKPKGRVGVVQKPEMGVEDFECHMKADGKHGIMNRKMSIRNGCLKLGGKLPDTGERLDAPRRSTVEDERRMKSRVDKVSDKSAEKSKDRVAVVQQFERQVEDLEYQMKTDDELDQMITRIENRVVTMSHSHRLSDREEKMKATLQTCVANLQRRKRSRVDKDEREEDVVKRMRRLTDEVEAEKKQGNEVKGKLIDAETKIMELEAHVADLQEKLHDSAVRLDASEEEKEELLKRLDIVEKKCASVADDSKWLLEEGLPLLVRKLVNELSKENSMTVSELRTWHQRSRSDSS